MEIENRYVTKYPPSDQFKADMARWDAQNAQFNKEFRDREIRLWVVIEIFNSFSPSKRKRLSSEVIIESVKNTFDNPANIFELSILHGFDPDLTDFFAVPPESRAAFVSFFRQKFLESRARKPRRPS